ncbi:ExbD/TolR family protein [Tenacibaculum xiamenense]|uniref:hypothetical protein n=1 Tax=Tenacibaculum xiamenense TaxID=1261553 RepID=UPI003895322C
MKKLLLPFAILLSSLCYSQIKDIQLPKNGGEMNFKKSRRIISLFDVYLKKNGDVYVQDSLVSFEQLGNMAYKFIINHPFDKFNTIAPLNIDVNTPYKYVDKLKKELKKTQIRYYYRTDNIEDFTLGIYLFSLEPTLFYRTSDEKSPDGIKLITFEEYQSSGTSNHENFIYNLYSKKYKLAKEFFVKMKIKKMKFIDSTTLTIGGKKFSSNDTEAIHNEIKEADICFIEYQPELPYSIYFENIQCIRKELKLRNKLYNKKDKMRIPNYSFISHEMLELLKNADIKI